MAMVQAETVSGFTAMPALRQVGLMVGLAASVALGVAVVLWSQTPNYSLLYGNLSDRDASQVMEALQQSNIPFKLDEGTGAILVPSGDVHKARLQLASSGLPASTGEGFELLDEEQSFGTSQFMENARYQRALEGELGHTVSTLRNVERARVHLALPKRSVFLRNQQKPTASVVVNLYAGRSLDEEQVASIVHLVASSVPHLDPDQVTVVDQFGKLLSNPDSDSHVGMSSTQFAHTRKVEMDYKQRIENLLSPLVGVGKVRTQVAAELDFTVTEKTMETYNPDLPALRSEQTSEDSSSGLGAPFGVPGTLSNQPPGGGVAPEVAAGGEGAAPDGAPSGNASRRVTRNYELDKTISHTRLASGGVRRLSIAVVLDDKQIAGADGSPSREPWSEEELEKFTVLVKEAVGFSPQRGDSVQVLSAPFQAEQQMEPLPDPPIYEQPWVWDAAKQGLGVLGVLILIFGVLKPALNNLTVRGIAEQKELALAAAGEGGLGEGDQAALEGPGEDEEQLALPGSVDYEKQMDVAKEMVKEDPKLVAQVMKTWVNDDG